MQMIHQTFPRLTRSERYCGGSYHAVKHTLNALISNDEAGIKKETEIRNSYFSCCTNRSISFAFLAKNK